MPSIITSLFQASSVINGMKPMFVGDKKTKIGELVLDASLTEVITLSSTITEHPIETKESISDHIFKNPLRIKIEGYITDSPIKILGLIETPLQNNSIDKLLSSAKGFLPFNIAAKPSIQGYQLLKKLYEERQLLNIVTKLDAFKNMAIESLVFNSDVDTGERLEFEAELVQVKFSNVRKSVGSIYRDKVTSALTSPKEKAGVVEKLTVPMSWAKQMGRGIGDGIGDGIGSIKDFLSSTSNYDPGPGGL